jgi:hypothetical protein
VVERGIGIGWRDERVRVEGNSADRETGGAERPENERAVRLREEAGKEMRTGEARGPERCMRRKEGEGAGGARRGRQSYATSTTQRGDGEEMTGVGQVERL